MVVRTLARGVFGLVLIALLSSPASAHRIQLDSRTGSDRRESIQGSWSDDGFRVAGNSIAVGYFPGGGRQPGHLQRGYVNYDLTGLRSQIPAGNRIVSAEFYSRPSLPQGVESATLNLCHVSASPALLQSTAFRNDSIYDDLGSGTRYGTFDLGRGSSGVPFLLNAAGLAAINANLNGSFTLGVALEVPASTPLAFNVSVGSTLEVTYGKVPEPGGAALLALGVCAALASQATGTPTLRLALGSTGPAGSRTASTRRAPSDRRGTPL